MQLDTVQIAIIILVIIFAPSGSIIHGEGVSLARPTKKRCIHVSCGTAETDLLLNVQKLPTAILYIQGTVHIEEAANNSPRAQLAAVVS